MFLARFPWRKSPDVTLTNLDARVSRIEARLGMRDVQETAGDPIERALQGMAQTAGFTMPERRKESKWQ